MTRHGSPLNKGNFSTCRSPLSNQAIGAILQPDSMKFINALCARKGYSAFTVTEDNWHEVVVMPERLAFIAVHVARDYFEKGKYLQSILWAEVAIENNHPDKAIISHNIGISYLCLGDKRGAIESFKKAIEYGYDNPVKIAEYIEALEAKEKLPTITTDPMDGGIFYELGALYARDGDYERATEFFNLGRKFTQLEFEISLGFKDLPNPSGLIKTEDYGTPLGDTKFHSGSVSSADDSGVFDDA